LYRDSLDTAFDGQKMMTPPIDAFTKHVCVTDQNGPAREMVGSCMFEFTAGGFFQNNNAILPLLVDYVQSLIDSGEGYPTHLVDTYCGSGLFAITLSSRFEKVAGIELSQASIVSAKNNAKLNRIPSDKLSFPFLSGDAANIFDTVKDFPSNQTVVVIDPPRKGCDELFLKISGARL
jgi:tRNA (uracil-5-)-methyltransferase